MQQELSVVGDAPHQVVKALEGTTTPVEFRKLDVAVRNTYPITIKLLSVTARHSTLSSTDRGTVFKGSINKQPRPSSTRIRFRIDGIFPYFLFPFISRRKAPYPLLDVMHKTSSFVNEEPLYVNAEKGSSVTIDEAELSRDREVYVTAEEGAQVLLKKSKASKPGDEGEVISPMSEVVSEYVWKTNHWVLFIPARIGIDIALKYEINGEVRSQVVSSLFDIKPPIHSVVLGGVAGGIIGSLARSFTEADTLDINTRFFVKLIGACLLSIMAVISLSRKSGSQSFITVEDFFGSFVLGSLIGYEGTTFFEKTVINGKDAASAANPVH